MNAIIDSSIVSALQGFEREVHDRQNALKDAVDYHHTVERRLQIAAEQVSRAANEERHAVHQFKALYADYKEMGGSVTITL